MAMNGDQMGQEIADAIMNTAAPPDVQAQVVGLWQKIAGAIVKHIQNNAEVPPGIAVIGGATSAAGEVK